MDIQSVVSARVNCEISIKKRSGKPSRRSSDEVVSPRSVLDARDSITTTTTAAAAASSSSSYDDDDDDEPSTPPAAARQPAWKGVAEAWRSRTSMRRLPSLSPAMSSTLRRRFSIRSFAASRAPADDGNHACALRPPIRTFSLSELKKATRNFSKELGHVVSLSHPNIARLVGVGVDGGEHLVFPFSSLGCLSGRLHGGGEEAMPWTARFKVAVGTARGLEYLHERCARRIVHRDVKPANILLKDDYEPMVPEITQFNLCKKNLEFYCLQAPVDLFKICDFGLAKWLPANLTHYQVTTFEGTFGYLPPEYTSHGIFNEKTDVFAYGIVLLELLTGRRAIDAKKLSLLTWARQFLHSDSDDDGEAVRKMVDPALGGRYDGEQLAGVAHAAKLCIHNSPELRPQMSQVTRILQGNEEHGRGEGPSTSATDHAVDRHQTNGQDSATRRQLDDLRRHKALAFDFDWEHTSSAEIEHLSSVHSN
uniref:Protein kinase domain-containing protein n=1 Tax=Leersia perrieri TaxID=77586 RepID=A0A0D9XUN3_9ORYZ